VTVAIAGPRGRLGSCLVSMGALPLECNITDRDSVQAALDKLQPRTLINCAAWTDVDGAESAANIDACIAANVRGPGILRREFGGYFIQISTGYIFNGKGGPYDELAAPQPINRYGMSKLGGEMAAQIRQPTLIVRTLDLFGPNTRNDFVRQVRDMLELGQPCSLPANLYGSPTYIPYLAEGVLAAEKMGLNGILNISGDEVLSRYRWGQMIAEAFGHDPALILPTDMVKGAAPRPLRGGLLVEKAKSLGVPIHGPLDGLKDLAERSDGT
jgi:dTDP-4-dehydrorhamnose reductase